MKDDQSVSGIVEALERLNGKLDDALASGRRSRRGGLWAGTSTRPCSASAEARRSATQAKQAQALRKWNASDLPGWLEEDTYPGETFCRYCPNSPVKSTRLTLGVSHPYATLIRRGMTIPNPRHWLPLADLVGYRK